MKATKAPEVAELCIDRARLYYHYWIDRWSARKIARIVGTSHQTILSYMKRYNISRRDMSSSKIGQQAMEKHHNWKGGRRIAKDGYIHHLIPDHPNANKKGYVSEGRLILENILCDYLPTNSIVHHFNGDVQDNRPENLMYFDCQGSHTSHHQKLIKLKGVENER